MIDYLLISIAIWFYAAGFSNEFQAAKPFNYPIQLVIAGCLFWPIFAFTSIFTRKQK